MLQSMGSQRVGHDLATEQQQKITCVREVLATAPASHADLMLLHNTD